MPNINSAIFVICSSLLSASGAYGSIISLGTADSFAVLAGPSITNTGITVIQGDLGVSPGSTMTGLPGASVTGTTNLGNNVAAQAENDLLTAYNFAAGQACGTSLSGHDLGGLTLTPGVYCFSSSAQLTGTLTLDARNDPNANFLFQIGSTLTTADASAIVFRNGGQGNQLSFQVGSSATLGTATAFQGDILALASINLNTGATIVCGRALAIGGVTLDTNTISIGSGGCEVPTSGTPEPNSILLLSSGLFLSVFFLRGRQPRWLR